MTIKNKRKRIYLRRVFDGKSIVERMRAIEDAHNIQMFTLQQASLIALEALKYKAQLELNEYKKQAEAYLQTKN